MKKFALTGWLVSACCVVSLAANAAGRGPSEAGLRDVENGWSKAFVTGDTKTPMPRAVLLEHLANVLGVPPIFVSRLLEPLPKLTAGYDDEDDPPPAND